MSVPETSAYLDTSTFMRRAEAMATNPSERNERIALAVQNVLDGPQVLAISELTIIEYRNNVAVNWRRAEPEYQQYDDGWAEAAVDDLMELLGSGRVRVISTPAHAVAQASTLVTIATREHRMKFKAWDAMHLVIAAAWAGELGCVVDLYTSDGDFDRFLAVYPHFGQLVSVVCFA